MSDYVLNDPMLSHQRDHSWYDCRECGLEFIQKYPGDTSYESIKYWVHKIKWLDRLGDICR